MRVVGSVCEYLITYNSLSCFESAYYPAHLSLWIHFLSLKKVIRSECQLKFLLLDHYCIQIVDMVSFYLNIRQLKGKQLLYLLISRHGLAFGRWCLEK